MNTVAAAVASAWRVDPAHSHVEFAVRHLMISTVKGEFTDVSGTLTGDETDPGAASIELTIPVAGIHTRESQRDAHLRSSDFFDAGQHPAIEFRSTRIVPAGTDSFAVTGDLTIRGITRSVTLTVHADGRGRDPWGGERVGYSATTTINRKDFGLNWNQVLETGGVLVGDDVKVSVDLQLVRTA